MLSKASDQALLSAEKFIERLCNDIQLQHSLAFQIYRLKRKPRSKGRAPLKRFIGIGYRDKGTKDVSHFSTKVEADKAAFVFAEDCLNDLEREHLAEFIDSEGWIDISVLPYWVGPLLSVLPQKH
jgi:hypothetical protein